MYSNQQKQEMNTKALAIVKGMLIGGSIIGSLMAFVPSHAHASEAQDKGWLDYAKYAIAQSIKQTGSSSYTHFCQPEVRSCFSGVSYKNDRGVTVFLRETFNIEGERIAREACSMNEHEDVRHCINWDTQEKHADMKDRNGDWHLVSSSFAQSRR